MYMLVIISNENSGISKIYFINSHESQMSLIEATNNDPSNHSKKLFNSYPNLTTSSFVFDMCN